MISALKAEKDILSNTPMGGMVTFSGTAWANPPAKMEMAAEMEMSSEDAAAAPKLSTAKGAWAFVISSDLQDIQLGTSYTVVAKNLRTGVVTTLKVDNDKGYGSTVWADLNRKDIVEAGDKVEIALIDENGTVVSGPFERTVQTSDINNAYLSVQMRVGDVRPKETILGQNFPNPFNPETWIPYQLSRDSNVAVQIYNVFRSYGSDAKLRSQVDRFIYDIFDWRLIGDGKNEAGEHVSSGIYFYVLQTANFTATRRMVILK